MLVGSVAGIDDRDVENAGEVERRSGGGVPEHNHVGVQCLDVLRSVAQRFALGCGGTRTVERNDVGAEAFRRHVERHAGARARLQEQVDDGLAAQGGDSLDTALKDFLERGRGRVNLVDLGEAQLFEREQVAAGPGHEAEKGRSVSARRTLP
jgi:hypothetical protein